MNDVIVYILIKSEFLKLGLLSDEYILFSEISLLDSIYSYSKKISLQIE